MHTVFASIITIGDELLIGQVIDTNSAWMAQELNKWGIPLKRRVAIGDSREEILKTLEEESTLADIILITGGLGPTADDITKPVLCEYFGGKLVVDEGALANVKNIFEKILNRPMIERNLKQAEVPDVCTVIQNKRGTAPGMWFEKDGKVFVSMPGVPHEMKGMMTDDVLPALPKHFKLTNILHRTMLTAGLGESFLAERIKDYEAALPSFIKLAYLPNYGMLRLRLTAMGDDKEKLASELDRQFALLLNQLTDVLVTDEDLPLPHVVSKILKERGKTLSTAESCTGGYIAHLITSQAGSSEYYKGGVVSYANSIKEDVLQVPPQILEATGAVSEATVIAMVKGALELAKTDFALATSGIMGPGGGSVEKPVGMVWVAVGNRENIIAKQFNFRFDRQRNIELTANNALNLLRKFILEQS